VSYDQDPSRQIGYLQQVLASDKKPLGFFLGAGCPMAIRVGPDGTLPLIPDMAGVTEMVRLRLTGSDGCGRLLGLVEEQLKKDGRDNATLEDILTHIRALRAVVGRDRVRRLSAEDLDRLDDRICELVQEIADQTLPGADTPYHSIAAWVDAVHRESPVEVFTTNYDLLMEQAFESVRVPYFDGFAGARKPFFDLRAMEEDVLPPRWARLWKLHGSVNWYQVPKGGVFRGTSDEADSQKRVIYPSHLKYEQSRRMPYLAMIDRLRAFLKQTTAALVLCGCSFRDDHITEVIVQGLRSTQTAVAFALLFGELANYPRAVDLATKRPNLNILARDGGVISGQESRWLQKDPGPVAPGDTKWLKWVPAEEGMQKAELALGDFATFGQLLQEVTGRARQLPDQADAQ
jgi:SIR2-like domain